MNSKRFRWLAFIFCITMVFSSFGGVGMASPVYADENPLNVIVEETEEFVETDGGTEIQPIDVIDKDIMMRSRSMSVFAETNSASSGTPGATFIDKNAVWFDESNRIGKITIDVWGNPVLSGTDVILILDRSGSMGNNNKLANTKNAAKKFVDSIYEPISGTSIQSDNRIAIVTFSTNATKYPNAPGETLLGVDDTVNGGTTSTDYFKTTVINGMTANGWTNYTKAFDAAKSIIDGRTDITRPTYIVFMSDGEPTIGYGVKPDGQSIANTLKTNGTEIYALGFGLSLSQFNNYIVPLASSPSEAVIIADVNTDLAPIFEGIAGEIKNAGTSAVVTDWLDSNYFELATAPAVTKSYESSHGSIYTDLDGSIVWELGNITETPKQLTIYIHLKDCVTDLGFYPTNTKAQNKYTDYEENIVEKIAPIPELDVVYCPTLAITKSADRTTYGAVGDVITYTYLLENTSNALINGPIIVNDDKLGEITFAGGLAPNATGAATATHTVTQADLDAGMIVNVANASISDGAIKSNDSTATVTAVTAAGLEIVKSANKETYNKVGDLITYTYTVENTGNVTLEGPFTITDDLLSGIPDVTGPLAPGATGSATTTYAVTQADLDEGMIVNVASANFGNTTSNEDTVTVTAVKGPKLKLTKTADRTTYGAVGDVITYTYLLENTGNVTLEGPFSIIDDKIMGIPNVEVSLDPGATYAAISTYAVIQADLITGSIVNIASAGCIHNPEGGYEPAAVNDQGPGDVVGNGCNVISNTSSAIVMANYTVTYLPGTSGNFGTATHSGLAYGAMTPTPPAATTDQSNVVFTGWSPSWATTVSATVVYTAQWRTTGGGGGGGGTVTIPEVEIPAALTDEHIAYIQGYPDNMVRPEGNVTREEVAAVFFRLLEPTYRDSIRMTKSNFNDMGDTRWSTKHVGTLVKGSIIKGYPDGTFKPGSNITRAELATIAARFDDLIPTTGSIFTDINNHWAKEYINSSVEKGWVKGYPDSTFKPNQYITRAEFVTLVNNVLQRRVHTENILPEARQFPDLVKGRWYYEAMQESINSHLYERLEDNFEKWTEIYKPVIEM